VVLLLPPVLAVVVTLPPSRWAIPRGTRYGTTLSCQALGATATVGHGSGRGTLKVLLQPPSLAVVVSFFYQLMSHAAHHDVVGRGMGLCFWFLLCFQLSFPLPPTSNHARSKGDGRRVFPGGRWGLGARSFTPTENFACKANVTIKRVR